MRFRKYRIKCFGDYDRIAIQCAFCSRRVKCEAATPVKPSAPAAEALERRRRELAAAADGQACQSANGGATA